MVWESNFVYFDYKNNIRPNPDPLGKDSYFFVLERPFAGGPPVDPSAALVMGFDPNSYQNTGIERFQWRNDLTAMIYDDLRSPLPNIVSSLDVLYSIVPENDR